MKKIQTPGGCRHRDKVWMLPVTAGLRKVEVKVKLDERTMIVLLESGQGD